MEEQRKDFKHIVRIVNTDLDGNKPILDSLRKIKGVGFMFSNMICHMAGVDKHKQTGYLSDDDILKIEDVLKDPVKHKAPAWMLNRRGDVETGEDIHVITGDLKFQQENDIKMMKMIRSYKGVRHSFGQPVRGQKTRSNFRKNKGKVMGVKRSAGAKSGGKT
jgi:small subunit ribosomal protein S13